MWLALGSTTATAGTGGTASSADTAEACPELDTSDTAEVCALPLCAFCDPGSCITPTQAWSPSSYLFVDVYECVSGSTTYTKVDRSSGIEAITYVFREDELIEVVETNDTYLCYDEGGRTYGSSAPCWNFVLVSSTRLDTGADTALPDTGISDTAVHDTGASDTAVWDTSVTDTGVSDTSVSDTSVGDTSVTDTSVADTSGVDHTAHTAHTAHTGQASSKVSGHTGPTDTGPTDTGPTDTSTPGTDTGTLDTATIDTDKGCGCSGLRVLPSVHHWPWLRRR